MNKNGVQLGYIGLLPFTVQKTLVISALREKTQGVMSSTMIFTLSQGG